MMKRLNHRRILIVDDEPDVLHTLESLLNMCDVVKASSYSEAKQLLETEYYDLAILDIMGVDGYGLLKTASKKGIIAVMLTAHAFSCEDTIRSYKEGAAYYVPKEKIGEITTYLEDVLESKEKRRSFWFRWLDRFGSYYDEKLGKEWMVNEKEFWTKMRNRE